MLLELYVATTMQNAIFKFKIDRIKRIEQKNSNVLVQSLRYREVCVLS